MTLEELIPDKLARLWYLIGRLRSNSWDCGYACGNPDANAGDDEKYRLRAESNEEQIRKILDTLS